MGESVSCNGTNHCISLYDCGNICGCQLQNSWYTHTLFQRLSHTLSHSFFLIRPFLHTLSHTHLPSVQEAQLTTVHSWFGILAITLFCGSYVMGLYMWGMKLSQGGNEGGDGKSSERGTIRRGVHVALGGSTLLAVTVAICTGIMNYLGRSGCVNSTVVSQQGSEQTADYTSLPPACTISNGLGVVVAGATVCTLATVAWRAILLSSGGILDPVGGYSAPEEEGRQYAARPR